MLGMKPLAQIRLGIQSVDAHQTHQAPHFFAVDDQPMIPLQDSGDRPITPGRFIGVQFVNPAHDPQIHIRPLFGLGLSIQTGSIDRQKLCLPFDRQTLVATIDELFTVVCARGFAQIFF